MNDHRPPLVSVVTPCLNPGRRLEGCLASVRQQRYAPVEHVVVDGGSTDGTLERLRAAPGVRWVSEPDDGQTAALNKGLALASGAIIVWLNADDALWPDVIARGVAALARSPAAGFAYGDCEIVEPQRTWTWRPAPELTLAAFSEGSPLPQPGSLLLRSALEEVGYLDESFRLAMDYDLWLRLFLAGFRGTYIPHTLATFEIHDTSKSGAIARAEFVLEEARALSQSGLARQAAVTLGRAAAERAHQNGHVPSARLAGAVRECLAAARGWQPLDAHLVEGSARVRAARLELDARRIQGLRHLVSPVPWRYPELRSRVVRSARTSGWTRAASPADR